MPGFRKHARPLAFLVALICVVPTMSAFGAPGSSDPAQDPPSAAEMEDALTRMAALAKEEKWRELVDQFKDVDFSAWPRAGDAFYYRGVAYMGLENAANAERDLKTSLEHSPKEGWFWYNLGQLYRRQLKKDVEAAEAYKKAAALEDKIGWMPVSATLAAVEIRLSRVEPDAALQVLRQYTEEDLKNLSGSQRSRLLQAYGRTYAAQGREAEAWAAFRGKLTPESERSDETK